jgi:hypothetical protein
MQGREDVVDHAHDETGFAALFWPASVPCLAVPEREASTEAQDDPERCEQKYCQ